MLVVALGHFNRIAISVAGAERIIRQNGIDAKRGWDRSIPRFCCFYTLAMVPAGWLIDRFGARATLSFLFWLGGLRRRHERGRAFFAKCRCLCGRTACRPFADGPGQCAVASRGGPHGVRPCAAPIEIARQRLGDIRGLCGNLGHVLRFRCADRSIRIGRLRVLRDGMDHARRRLELDLGNEAAARFGRTIPSRASHRTSPSPADRYPRNAPRQRGSVFLRPGVICLTLSYVGLGLFPVPVFLLDSILYRHHSEARARRVAALFNVDYADDGTGDDFRRLAGRPGRAVPSRAARDGGWSPRWA